MRGDSEGPLGIVCGAWYRVLNFTCQQKTSIILKVNPINSVMEGVKRREEAELTRAVGTQRAQHEGHTVTGRRAKSHDEIKVRMRRNLTTHATKSKHSSHLSSFSMEAASIAAPQSSRPHPSPHLSGVARTAREHEHDSTHDL